MSLFALVAAEGGKVNVVNTETDEILHTADDYEGAQAVLDDLESSRKDEPQ